MTEGVGLRRRGDALRDFAGGATGAGIVLVLLPCIALYYGLDRMNKMPVVGLPLLAIFGIMILFGAMALVSTLFERLGLANASEALALPKGSVRAAIALSLIVLFAIISIMLFQTMAHPYIIPGLNESDKNAVLGNPANRVLAVELAECKANSRAPASSAQAGPDEDAGTPPTANQRAANTGADAGTNTVTGQCYNIHIVQPPGQEAVDLAKQLLILIGTLMTSLTAYYFAAQSTVAAVKSVAEQSNSLGGNDGPDSKSSPPNNANQPPASQVAASVDAPTDTNADEVRADGCDIVVTEPTEDKDLPPAKGGVAL